MPTHSKHFFIQLSDSLHFPFSLTFSDRPASRHFLLFSTVIDTLPFAVASLLSNGRKERRKGDKRPIRERKVVRSDQMIVKRFKSIEGVILHVSTFFSTWLMPKTYLNSPSTLSHLSFCYSLLSLLWPHCSSSLSLPFDNSSFLVVFTFTVTLYDLHSLTPRF